VEHSTTPQPSGQPPETATFEPAETARNTNIELETFLRMAVSQGVSDIHLRVGTPPALRRDGAMHLTKLPPMDEQGIMRFARGIFPDEMFNQLKDKKDVDFSFELDGVSRFRVNLFYELNKVGLVLRIIPLKIPSMQSMDLPSTLVQFTNLHRGLVLVTGPTGSGKSTTLAAMLNTINERDYRHIVTLEDPIEFVHADKSSIITQRQIGLDTDTFLTGIKQSLRQDPDVILIGEMRDRETILAAIQAAETGHLVFSTLHTADSVQTINRIINAFQPHERDPIRIQLASVLQGAVSQRLVAKAEGRGRVAVNEVLVVTSTVRDYILKNEMEEIYQLLNSGGYDGMMSLNHSLLRAYQNNTITADAAISASENPVQLNQMLRGAYHGTYS
jgi:twitching motility protein PilT